MTIVFCHSEITKHLIKFVPLTNVESTLARKSSKNFWLFARLFVPLTNVESTPARKSSKNFWLFARLFVPLQPT